MRETPTGNHNFLTSIGVGRRLGLGADRVRQLAREGRLKATVVLPGGQRLFDSGTVESFASTRAERHPNGDEAV